MYLSMYIININQLNWLTIVITIDKVEIDCEKYKKTLLPEQIYW